MQSARSKNLMEKKPQSSPSQVGGDPTSPTGVKQGLERNNDVPLSPSTPSSGRRVGNEGQ